MINDPYETTNLYDSDDDDIAAVKVQAVQTCYLPVFFLLICFFFDVHINNNSWLMLPLPQIELYAMLDVYEANSIPDVFETLSSNKEAKQLWRERNNFITPYTLNDTALPAYGGSAYAYVF